MRRYIATIAAAFCALTLIAGKSDAATISFSETISPALTNWTTNVDLPKFDPALGTLNSITFELEGDVGGLARFESLDAASTTVTTKLSANIRLRRPDLSDLVISTPSAQTVESVGAFDGNIDFGGASGRTYDTLAASDFESSMLTAPFSPLDQSLFIGAAEMVTLNVRAVGQSHGAGAGNLLLQFNTLAGADVSVTYDYTPIPEPTTLVMLLAGMALLRRRR